MLVLLRFLSIESGFFGYVLSNTMMYPKELKADKCAVLEVLAQLLLPWICALTILLLTVAGPYNGMIIRSIATML